MIDHKERSRNIMTDTIFFESPSVFSVPCEVVDKHLNAPEVELRLLLLLLRNGNTAFLKADLCGRLQIDEKRLAEALRYWVQRGVLFESAGKFSLSRPKLTASDLIKYDPSTVAQRMEDDPGIRYLYGEAERSLKKPLTSEDAAVVLSLVGWCGLPPEVVALLLRHGTDNGMSLRQIQKTGIRWADEGVNSFEKAEERIAEESKKKQTVNRIAARLGILGTRALSEGETNAFLRWNDDYSYGLDMIGAAYEAMIKSTGKYSYAYLDKILTKWHDEGYTEPPAAPAASGGRKPKGSAGKKIGKTGKVSTEAMDWAWKIADENEEA